MKPLGKEDSFPARNRFEDQPDNLRTDENIYANYPIARRSGRRLAGPRRLGVENDALSFTVRSREGPLR
jgi:hypothetical protein